MNLQGAVIGEQAGFSVALSNDGRIAAVGAVLNDDNGENVRVFQYNVDNQSWLALGQPIVGESPLDNSGFSLDMSADGFTIVIGTPEDQPTMARISMERRLVMDLGSCDLP